MAKRKKPVQTSLIERGSRFSHTEVLQFANEHGLKGDYKQVYNALRAVRYVEALGFTVSKA